MQKPTETRAEFGLGQVVRHRVYPFRGVVFDVDPEFNNTEEWYQQIPEDLRPRKDQPFYHLLAESEDGPYIAYVSQQNLLLDTSRQPCLHPQIPRLFDGPDQGRYTLKAENVN